MTIEELIKALERLPKRAEVYFPNMEIDDECSIHRVVKWSDRKIVFDKEPRR